MRYVPRGVRVTFGVSRTKVRITRSMRPALNSV